MIKNGFTLIELLVVIAIIGIISGIMFVSMNPKEMIDSSKTANVVTEMNEIKRAVSMFVLDTDTFPNDCRLDCTEDTDSLISPQGVPGWNGPYLDGGLWNKKTPWGGQLGLVKYDSNGNGLKEVWLVLDDDAPGTNYSDNSGTIPQKALQEIDNRVDDGDLDTGDMFLGDNKDTGGIFAPGEGAWRIFRIGEGV